MNMTFLILNGPNLGHIGTRQPEIYGHATLDDLPEMIQQVLCGTQVGLEFFQSNSEGALIDRLEQAHADGISGVAFNAGAYTHTSLALADCVAWITPPVMEVHLSNIFARTDQPLRQQSLLGQSCIGVIAGCGLLSYALAVRALFDHVRGSL